MSQNSQENTCEFYEISKNTFSCRTPLVAAAVDLKTILVFLECINPLKFYLLVDDFPVSKVKSLTIDKIEPPLFSLALLF